MRVLFLTGEYPPMQGGVGDYTRLLGRALQTSGVEVHVLTSVAARADVEPSPTVHPLVRRWNWNLWRQVPTLVRRLQPQVVHIEYQTAAFALHPAINLLPWWLRRVAGTRCIVTFHDLREPYLFPKAGRLRPWANRQLARQCERSIATNREDAQRLRGWNLRHPPAEIPIGSNIFPQPPADYDRDGWRAQHGVGPNDILLCYFGFLNASKGGETLARALSQMEPAAQPIRLWMVGGQVGASDTSNRVYLEKVEGLLTDLGVSGHVRWTGYTTEEEVSANLLAADIAVLPYRDGASFRRGSFLATLAHGLPIVTTTPSVPLPELADGQTVMLVPPDDPTAVARAVQRLASDEGLRKRLADGARHVASAFTWGAIAARHVKLYRSLDLG